MQLKTYLPPHVFFIKEMEQITKSEQIEVDLLNAKVQDLMNQCFVNTATWGLTLWEDNYGIKTDLSKDISFRRSNIIAKMRGQGVTTKNMIKNVAESFSYGEVEVIEVSNEYRFIIKFVGTKGLPPNMDDLQNSIEEIKPAHLGFTFEYIYNTYLDIQAFQFKTLNAYTWSELINDEITNTFTHEKLKQFTHQVLGGIL